MLYDSWTENNVEKLGKDIFNDINWGRRPAEHVSSRYH